MPLYLATGLITGYNLHFIFLIFIYVHTYSYTQFSSISADCSVLLVDDHHELSDRFYTLFFFGTPAFRC